MVLEPRVAGTAANAEHVAAPRNSAASAARSLRALGARFRFPGSVALGALFLLLVASGVRGEWVTFPLSASLRAREIFFMLGEQPGRSGLALGAALQLLVFAGAVTALVSRASSAILFAAAAALVVTLPIQTAFYRVSWVQAYLRQSNDRLLFGSYVSEHFVDNQSPEPAFVPITQFQDATDQLWLGFQMMGWGWYLALGASLGLLVLSLRGARIRQRPLLGLGLWALFSLLLAAPAIRGLVIAERELVRGDRFLVAGKAQSAIEAYENALRTNPALADSKPFLVKASLAFNVVSAGKHPLGLLGQDLGLTERRSSEGQADLFDAARERLMQRGAMDGYRPTSLDEPLQRAAARLESDLWRLQGIGQAKQRQYAAALGSFSRAAQEPDSLSMFFLAHVYLVQGSYEPAIQILDRLEGTVAQKSIHADLICTLGDAYTASGDIVRARTAYRQCRELDKLDNFRATKALTGS